MKIFCSFLKSFIETRAIPDLGFLKVKQIDAEINNIYAFNLVSNTIVFFAFNYTLRCSIR